ncbi:glutamyl-tRNA reductase [Sulfuracidifex tepidarius]|uniref:Glutamyl-tRNA reductase n=1 Tax=Sulfuracidifex tepidarius TaxID=1294262 RepID=A0A510DWH5_9CREN|nr:glutamyl-tRNA reductase [Sulfuracidifex tepidarius]BBG24549.1 Glutamyl-tRNA reductase [Sulfuracidifex tepidarius]BBG27337.1 Glutamyl-tRNA reductase [Sulfuracidifex tepidarius]
MLDKKKIEDQLNDNFSALIFTYKNVGIKYLHNYYLNECEIKKIHELVKGGFFVLQTCNRVEIYIHSENAKHVAESLLEHIYSIHNGKLERHESIIKNGLETIKHLFYVASGVDSIAVGEYEILNQIKNAMLESKKMGIMDKEIERLIERALRVGRNARSRTNISKGKVGIYSLTLDKIKSVINDLEKASVLVIGAGEIGSKMSELLYKEGIKNVTIMNRTLSKAEELGKKYGYNSMSLDFSRVSDFDVVISAVSGIRNQIKLEGDRPLILVDLSVPSLFYGKNVLTLTDLQDYSMLNMANRLEELPKIDEIVEEGVQEFMIDHIKEQQNEIISRILGNVERVRETEVKKAKRELEKRNINVDKDIDEVLDVMSKSIINKGLEPLIKNIKVMVENDERRYINFLIDVFNYGHIPDDKTEEIKRKETPERSDG